MHTILRDELALDTVTWMGRVSRFVDGMSDETLTVERHIRKAYYLQCLAPVGFKRLMVPTVDEAELETMLDQGAYGCAVERITGGTARSSHEMTGAVEADSRAALGGTPFQDTTDEHWTLTTLRAWALGFLQLRPVRH